ncbi:prophage antirepressor-like protein [Lactobacillus colini]|uniref:Prophage antirepressor-like protein n=1 Tax=Lactobacillus colini TaxID=1819254 RepID=A0ABS4MG14_9LACO|nr:phage antirepressor [Lactobacillus colini]MBP2058631.1 prophage antirepressor-like protein [Lactobacillus colini]
MNNLQLFNFEGNQVRTVLIDETPYFVGKDVATILDYKLPTKAIQDHVDNEDKRSEIVKASQIFQNGKGFINVDLITESGVYSLIFGSKMPNAKKFKHWVTSEVLPSIRKHGAYLTTKKAEEILLNPDTIINLAKQVKEERAKRQALENENRNLAGQLEEANKKVGYLDIILNTPDALTITQIAADYGMSAKKLNKLLHEYRVQRKVSDQWILYKVYMGKGYTVSKTIQFPDREGKLHTKLQTKWTQKGRKLIYDVLKENGILPLIERDDVA